VDCLLDAIWPIACDCTTGSAPLVIAVDTNILVYAHRRGVAEHRTAQRTIERASEDPRGWGVTLHSVGEFWSVVTHPAAAGRPSSPERARAFLQSLRREGGRAIWTPGPGFRRPAAADGRRSRRVRTRVFDLQIALTAFDHGAAELWTQGARGARSFTCR
jgi:hypothetical protein